MRRVPLLSLVALGCGWDGAAPVEPVDEPSAAELCAAELATLPPPDVAFPRGLRVAGNRIEDEDGEPIVLRGVNRSGSEYRCAQGFGFFDGPADEASVQAMTTWAINAVRVPLNEACWLNINGVSQELGGCNYKLAIKRYVNLLHQYSLIPILDLHWVGPGTSPADRLQPMPSEHSPRFWSDVARTFRDDPGVVFEPFNEPFPKSNGDHELAWQCWRDGCELERAVRAGETPTFYESTGMQALVDAIRAAGSEHLILLGGVQYANSVSHWLEYAPHDRAENLAAAWHVYNTNPCRDAECWDGAPRALAGAVPLVATELGQNDCEDTFVAPLLDWLSEHSAGYLAWSWNAYGPCSPYAPMRRSNPWSLITDYESAAPNSDYARAFYEHLLSRAD